LEKWESSLANRGESKLEGEAKNGATRHSHQEDDSDNHFHSAISRDDVPPPAASPPSSQLDLEDWPESSRNFFTETVAKFDSLERCLVWITHQGFRFDSSPAPSWLLLSILRLPAQVDTLLDLCHNVAHQLPGFDITSRNRLIALFIYRFADHGMINAIEPIYQLRSVCNKSNDVVGCSSSTSGTARLDDQGELAILRALQRLVCQTEESASGSEAQAAIARKLLTTHVKHMAGTQSRLLTLSVLDSLYLRKYLSKPLIRALETVRKRRGIELKLGWKRELFRYAVWQKDSVQAQILLEQLKEQLASTGDQREKDKTFRTLLRSLRYIDTRSDLYRNILEIQYAFADSAQADSHGRLVSAQEIAQSIQIATAAYSREVGPAEWHELCRNLSRSSMERNLSVVMKGYLFRNQATSAWKLWQRFYSTTDLDTLGVIMVIKVLARLGKVDEAIQLVDACHRLLNTLVNKTTVNALLRICARSGNLQYVQRIWDEMEERWNIRPDNITLETLLRATQIAPQAQITSFSQLVKRSFFSETADIKMYDDNAQDPEPEQASASKSDVAADERWWQTPSDAGMWLNWKSARALFRHILFRNHPSLVAVRSPLEGNFATGIGNIVFGHRQHGHPQELNKSVGLTEFLAKLPINSRHKDITYTSDTFHSYICLLNKHNLGDEMALCLEWMRQLKIQPHRKTLCLILLKVETSASPKQMRYRAGEHGWHKYALMTDGERLRDWLVTWLGAKRVPTEDELADFHMQQWNSDRDQDASRIVQP
jgi:pentatricopeptide repeat protein